MSMPGESNQIISSCNSAIKTHAHMECAQKYWLMIFTEKTSSCVRMKCKLGMQ